MTAFRDYDYNATRFLGSRYGCWFDIVGRFRYTAFQMEKRLAFLPTLDSLKYLIKVCGEFF